MKGKMKSVGLIALSVLLSVCLLCGIRALLGRQTTAYAAVVDDDVVCRATIDDNFEDNKILLTLKPEYSKFNKLSSGLEEKLFELGGIQIDNLTEFPASYVRADGTLNPKTAPSLTEYYKTTPFKQILAITLNKADKQYVLDTIKQIEMLDEIFCAYPNMIEELEYVPSDALYSNQWALNSTQGIHAQDAWDITRGASTVRVGVIDTGIASHNDLNANVVQGKDFHNDNLITSDDDSGHGTGVAGIIGAISNSQGISGIAPNTTIVPLQTSYWDEGRKNYLNTTEARTKAIQYAIDLWENTSTRISVLNHSIGGFGTNIKLLSYISNYPGLFVWGAGNDGYNVDDYADISKFKLANLISVGAIDKNDERSVWHSSQSSNYGINVDIYAPGGEGISSDYSKNIVTTSNLNNGYCAFYGTSAATPHVTGVAALMLSINHDLTGAQLKEILLNNADDINITIPDGNKQSVKKLNAFKSVKAVKPVLFETNYAGNIITGLNYTPSGELTIPDEINGKMITAIGENVFYNCTDLTRIIIPASVTSIGAQAFYGCSNLGKVIILNKSKAVTLGSEAFTKTSDKLKICVPEELYDTYTTATNWSGYTSRLDKLYLDANGYYYEKSYQNISMKNNINLSTHCLRTDGSYDILEGTGIIGGFNGISVSLCDMFSDSKDYSNWAFYESELVIYIEGVIYGGCYIYDNFGNYVDDCTYSASDKALYVPLDNLLQMNESSFVLVPEVSDTGSLAYTVGFDAGDVYLNFNARIYI